jgi:hypothetical protein
METTRTDIETVVRRLASDFGLRYRATVNIEGAVSNAVLNGLTLAQAEDFARDVLDAFNEQIIDDNEDEDT